MYFGRDAYLYIMIITMLKVKAKGTICNLMHLQRLRFSMDGNLLITKIVL